MLATSFVSALIAASAVYAHGNIDEVVVDATAYIGYLPYQYVHHLTHLKPDTDIV